MTPDDPTRADAPFSDPAFREAGAIRLREDRDAGAVLSAALRLGATTARDLGAAALAIAGPMYLLGGAARAIGGTAGGQADGGEVLGQLLDGVGGFLLTAAVFAFARLYATGAPTAVGDVWDGAKRLVWPLFRFGVATGLAFVVLAVPVLGAMALVGGSSPAGIAVAGTLALALVLAGAPFVSVAQAALALDGLGVRDAYARARGLLQGQFGRTLGTLALVGLLVGFVSVAVVGALTAAAGEGLGTGVLGALTTTVLSLAMLPVSVLITLFQVVLYGSVVERAEGTSLGEGLDDLAGALGAPRPGDETRPGAARPSDDLAHVLDDAAGDAAGDAPADPPAGTPGGFRGGGFSDRRP